MIVDVCLIFVAEILNGREHGIGRCPAQGTERKALQKLADFLQQPDVAGLALPVTTDAGLREQNWGQWTGMTVAQVEALFTGMPKMQSGVGWEFCPPGGESRHALWKRGALALARAAERWPGSSILVVTHNGMIRCLLNRCLGLQYLPGEPRPMRPHHLHLLTHEQGTLKIDTVNALDLTAGRE